jgi:hypothetical protein
MTFVVGLVGVLVGAMIAAAFAFWSTRRSELGSAYIAASVVVDELRCLLAADPTEPVDSRPLVAAWRSQRDALVVYLYPEEFESLGKSLLRAQQWDGTDEELRIELNGTLTEISTQRDRLRNDHQAFLLTPLARYLATRPWSRRRRKLRTPVEKTSA